MRAYGRMMIRIGIVALGMAALASCAVEGVGVDGSVGVGYVGGYYEPYGYDYGGWGPGYAVGPYRGGHGGWNRDRGHAPAFRPAPGGRSMPSLPGRPRGR
jgi:hypothetical protein